MEHIMQFGINIDDDAIKKTVIEYASETITKELHDEIRELVYGRYFGSNTPTGFVSENIEKFLEKHKDEFIYKAAEMAPDKLSRTKAAKEAAAKAICEKS